MEDKEIPGDVIGYFGITRCEKLPTKFSDDIWLVRSFRPQHHNESIFFAQDICRFAPEWVDNFLYKDTCDPPGYHMLLSIEDRDYIPEKSKL